MLYFIIVYCYWIERLSFHIFSDPVEMTSFEGKIRIATNTVIDSWKTCMYRELRDTIEQTRGAWRRVA